MNQYPPQQPWQPWPPQQPAQYQPPVQYQPYQQPYYPQPGPLPPNWLEIERTRAAAAKSYTNKAMFTLLGAWAHRQPALFTRGVSNEGTYGNEPRWLGLPLDLADRCAESCPVALFGALAHDTRSRSSRALMHRGGSTGCISNHRSGYVVECVEGTYSKSGGESGACSHHGGIWRLLYSH